DPRNAIAVEELQPKKNSYLALLWQQFEQEFVAAWEARPDWQATGVEETKRYPMLRKLSAVELPELPAETWHAEVAAMAADRFFRPHGAFETAETAAGTVFHRLMERIGAGQALG